MNAKHLIEKIREQKKPLIILICGMPGTRKSSTAVMLGGLLGFSVVVNMDEVRDIMTLYDKREIILGRSHNRWKLFGSLNDKNFLKGFFGHSRALKDGAMAVINKNISIGENIIIEGVHLVPSLYKDIGSAEKIHILLTAKDFSHHKNLIGNKFGRRHNIQKPWTDEKIQHVERIQKLLIKDAKKNKIFILESTDPVKNCAAIIKYLKKYYEIEKSKKYPDISDKRQLYNTYANFYRTRTKRFTSFLSPDYEFFLKNLSEKKILDLGSGPGRDSAIFKKRGYKPYCLDISEAMLELCKKQKLQVIHMNMEKIDLPPLSFNGIWSYTSFTTIPKIKVWKIINKLHKILKKDGALFLGLIEGNYEGWKPADEKYKFPRYVSRYSAEEVIEKIKEKFELVYFRKINKKETGRNTYLNFLFKKRL